MTDERKKIYKEFAVILLCAAAFGLTFLPGMNPFAFWICLAAALISARETIISGIKGIIRLRFDEEALMTIAVAAAFAIGEFREGAMVALLFSFGEELEDIAVDRSRDRIAALADIRPDTANVVSGETTETRPAESVKIGEQIVIKVGERVPIDCRVLEASVMADASALTGESIPVNVAVGETLKAGCVVLASPALGETIGEYGDSAAARIIDMVQNASEKKGQTEKFISRFCQIYTPIVVMLAVLIFAVTYFAGILSMEDALYRALVFLVSSCPCALVLSIPLAYFAGIGSASRAGVIIKGSEYCEQLANAKNAVFDKTGTLTSGKLRVAKIDLNDGFSEEEVLTLASAAETLSNHPIAKCVVEEAKSRGIEIPDVEKVNEIAGEGVTVSVGGKSVVCGNRKLFEHVGTEFSGAEGANLYVAINGKTAGSIFLEDTLREDSAETIAMLKKLDVSGTYMLTGDNEVAAAKIAEKCGLDGYYASLMPEDKVEKVEKIKESGITVFTGDGINDAPVLAAADVGAAMGMGSDAAIESADIVLMQGGVSALPKAISISKQIMKCVRQNVVFIMAVKIIVLIMGVFGYAPIWLAVFADVGVTLLAVLWSLRLLRAKA